MKILALSAFFPPYAYGGYENRVCDVMQELTRRGHEIQVLTTLPDKELNPSPATFTFPVYRRLHWTGRKLSWAEKLTLKPKTNRLGVGLVFLRQVRRDIADLQNISKVIRQFQPDLIYLGHILPLTKTIFPFFSHVTIPLVLDDGGKTTVISYQEHGLWYRFQEEFQPRSFLVSWGKHLSNQLVKFLSSGLLETQWSWPANLSVIFNSYLNLGFFQEVEIPIKRYEVFHSGLDLEKFSFSRPSSKNTSVSILVPGRIEPRKGQLDVVQLVLGLKNAGISSITKIVGDCWNTEYCSQLESMIKNCGLEQSIIVLPMVSKQNLIDLYHESDFCFFPSYHHTGFSRIPLEAMACGSVLLSYGNEGSDEILRDGENGFLIPSGNIGKATEIINQLAKSPERMAQIARSARKYMEMNHTMTAYVEKIEYFISSIREVR